MTKSFKFSMLNETFPVIFKHRDWSVFTNVISEVYQRNRNVTWFFGSIYFLDTKWIGTNWKLFNRKQKRWFLFDSWKWSIRKLFFCSYKNSSIFRSCPWKQKMVFPTFRIFNLCMGTTLVFSSSDDSSCHVSKKCPIFDLILSSTK